MALRAENMYIQMNHKNSKEGINIVRTLKNSIQINILFFHTDTEQSKEQIEMTSQRFSGLHPATKEHKQNTTNPLLECGQHLTLFEHVSRVYYKTIKASISYTVQALNISPKWFKSPPF